MISCRLYIKSGFNAENIPDTPELLNSNAFAFVDVSPLDLLQDANLSAVYVKAEYATVEGVDFAKIGSWYYHVVGIAMQSKDVARLSLIPSFFLTAGGITNLSILDGITERVHVAKSADVFGAFSEGDELMAPCKPMILDSEYLTATTDYATLIETNLELSKMASDATGVTYTDPVTNISVTIPRTITTNKTTEYEINGRTSEVAATYVYRVNIGISQSISPLKGQENAFAIGIENGGVINKVKFPTVGAVFTEDGDGAGGLEKIAVSPITLNGTLAYEWATGIRNAKILYSDLCNYGIMSTSGEKMEVDAATIYASGDLAPKITEYNDPHLDGRPYFRFQTVNGDTTFNGFWKNCISGLRWKQIPMIFTEKQGNAIDTLNYNLDSKIQTRQQQRAVITETVNTAGNMIAAGLDDDIGGVIGAAVAGGTGLVNQIEQFKDNRMRMAQQYALSQNVVKPQVAFPYNSEIIRDFMGDGVLLYRYRYSNFDVARIDRLLTMYGYKHTKALEKTDFINRPQFNYVKASASFTGNFPQWILDGIATEISGGVRVWHIKPTTAAYIDNE